MDSRKSTYSAGIDRVKRRNLVRQFLRKLVSHLVPQKGQLEKDLISELPDEIIGCILSHCTLREAAATSILSRRWRYVWTSIPNLNFDDALNEFRSETLTRVSYVDWVNNVLRQYTYPTMDEFRVCFQFEQEYSYHIDRWLEFAMSRRVHRLKLDLYGFGSFANRIPYSFPGNLFENQPCISAGFKSLKTLSLKLVSVKEETLEYVLSNCPSLESLSLIQAEGFESLRLVGMPLMLKDLKLEDCWSLDTIEICDLNLLSFTFVGFAFTEFFLKNVPLLGSVTIGLGFVELYSILIISELFCWLSQLKSLTLLFIWNVKVGQNHHLFPQLTSLKQLVIKIDAFTGSCLLEIRTLINAMPCLQRFVLQLIWLDNAKVIEKKQLQPYSDQHFQHLKVVEIAGYYGCTSDYELALYFIMNATALKKLIIDTHDQSPIARSSQMLNTDRIKEERAARSRARRQLQLRVPRNVELVIL